MKFLHFALGIASYIASVIFVTAALWMDSFALIVCSLLSLTLGEICHRWMSTYD